MHARLRRLLRASLVGVLLWGGGMAVAHAGAAPYLPQVGDELRYSVSNGDTAVTRVIRTRADGKRTYAQVMQTLLRKGHDPQISRFTVIRTEDGMAIQVDPVAGVLRLSPLIYYLAMVDPTDSWVAQKGIYRDADGNEVGYELKAEMQALETVSVRAGVFEGCARIAYRSSLAGAPDGAEMVFWVKPDLGIVKTRSSQGGQVTETELVSFERGAFAHP